MDKEELLERYEAYGRESDYTEARRLYEQALAGGAADARTLNGFGYSSAFLLERQGRLADAAGEWRFIIAWNEERGYDMTADWPRQELHRLESMQP